MFPNEFYNLKVIQVIMHRLFLWDKFNDVLGPETRKIKQIAVQENINTKMLNDKVTLVYSSLGLGKFFKF